MTLQRSIHYLDLAQVPMLERLRELTYKAKKDKQFNIVHKPHYEDFLREDEMDSLERLKELDDGVLDPNSMEVYHSVLTCIRRHYRANGNIPDHKVAFSFYSHQFLYDPEHGEVTIMGTIKFMLADAPNVSAIDKVFMMMDHRRTVAIELHWTPKGDDHV